MGSLSDDRKKRDEERRIAGLKKEIQDLEVELKEYEAAKEKVQNAKANWKICAKRNKAAGCF